MLILSLDTTTRAGSAAVLRDDTVLAAIDGNPSRTHGERLPGEIDAVLRQAGVGIGDIELLAVARGPGAFTGLRIGLAAMQGLAMVTGRPVIGVSALDALAAAAFAATGAARAGIGVWMDAARGEVFAAAYDAEGAPGGVPVLTPITEPEVAAPLDVLARWRHAGLLAAPAPAPVFTGDGTDRYAALVGDLPRIHAPALAPAVARLARRVSLGGGAHPPHELQPLYVRRPDAERSRS